MKLLVIILILIVKVNTEAQYYCVKNSAEFPIKSWDIQNVNNEIYLEITSSPKNLPTVIKLVKLNNIGEKQWDKTILKKYQDEFLGSILKLSDTTILLELSCSQCFDELTTLFVINSSNGEVLNKKSFPFSIEYIKKFTNHLSFFKCGNSKNVNVKKSNKKIDLLQTEKFDYDLNFNFIKKDTLSWGNSWAGCGIKIIQDNNNGLVANCENYKKGFDYYNDSLSNPSIEPPNLGILILKYDSIGNLVHHRELNNDRSGDYLYINKSKIVSVNTRPRNEFNYNFYFNDTLRLIKTLFITELSTQNNQTLKNFNTSIAFNPKEQTYDTYLEKNVLSIIIRDKNSLNVYQFDINKYKLIYMKCIDIPFQEYTYPDYCYSNNTINYIVENKITNQLEVYDLKWHIKNNIKK